MKKLFVFATLIIFCGATFAQSTIVPTPVPAPTYTYPITTTIQVDNINASGLGAGNIQAVTGGENLSLAEKAKKQCSANYFMCAVAVVSAAQAVIMIADYFKSKNTADASKCQGDFCNGAGGTEINSAVNNPNVNPYTYSSGDSKDPNNIVLRDAQEILKDMKDLGYEVDASTGSVKTPNGTMSADQISASAGEMSDAEKRALGIESASASATASVKPGEFEGSSETGGGKKPSSGGGESAGAGFDMNAYMRNLMGNSDGNRGVAGLSVRAGDDNIGVRESNIFEQVSRAYGTDKVLNRGP